MSTHHGEARSTDYKMVHKLTDPFPSPLLTNSKSPFRLHMYVYVNYIEVQIRTHPFPSPLLTNSKSPFRHHICMYTSTIVKFKPILTPTPCSKDVPTNVNMYCNLEYYIYIKIYIFIYIYVIKMKIYGFDKKHT